MPRYFALVAKEGQRPLWRSFADVPEGLSAVFGAETADVGAHRTHMRNLALETETNEDESA